MQTPPPDLSDADVAAAIASGWDINATSASYLPVGFGSHHWRVPGPSGDWFATVDDFDGRRRSMDESRDAVFERLRAALRAALSLREEGRSFVVAPVPTLAGGVLRRISDRYALAVYPYVVGRSRAWADERSLEERLAIVELLASVHGAPPHVRARAGSDDFEVASRDELEAALGDLGRDWDTGPYAGRARTLLADRASGVDRLLALHDRLAAHARSRPERAVLTHGEPHPGNTIFTEAGLVLVDWDTTLAAPPERDLWIPAEGDEDAIVAAYESRGGGRVLPEMLTFYRLTWDLNDVSSFVGTFRRRHDSGPDVDKAWRGLQFRLDLERRWPTLA